MKKAFFENAKFIKAPVPFEREYTGREPAPAFRKHFYLSDLGNGKATLRFCALGYGVFYVNGAPVTEDLFVSPVSDYNKTLWVNEYDVKCLLRYGRNVITVQLGNGFYNESFDTPWKLCDAQWRDSPKVIAELFIDGKSVLATGAKFKCKPVTSTVFNQWRVGETYDARKEDGFERYDYDCTEWEFAAVDDAPPTGVFRLTECEPIRACETLPVCEIIRNKTGWVLDFGKNISGYVRAKFFYPAGTEITLRHAEQIDADGALKLNGLNILYPQVPFQTDRVICGDVPFSWHPKFVYHGFRYVEVEGLPSRPNPADFAAVFVHQDIARRTAFSCSDTLINWIYDAGIRASYSNLFYSLTDCPTREKYGWTNDAQASAEQLCVNFDMRAFFRKWMVDIADTMREDGDLSAVAPTGGYGYGHGPVADGALFEIPYRVYELYGDDGLIRYAYPYCKRAYVFLANKYEKGEEIVLGDWDGVKSLSTSKKLLADLYLHKFARLLALFAARQGLSDDETYYGNQKAVIEKRILRLYFNADGVCTEDTQTALGFLIDEGFAALNDKLAAQFVALIERQGRVMDCGMVGMQFLFKSLHKIGRPDLAFVLAVSRGEKSFVNWYAGGGTTLWETWQDGYTDSKNHHMFSEILAWFITGLGGIKAQGKDAFIIRPAFVPGLSSCAAEMLTEHGTVKVTWTVNDGRAQCTVYKPRKIKAAFYGERLAAGENAFNVLLDGYGQPTRIEAVKKL